MISFTTVFGDTRLQDRFWKAAGGRGFGPDLRSNGVAMPEADFKNYRNRI